MLPRLLLLRLRRCHGCRRNPKPIKQRLAVAPVEQQLRAKVTSLTYQSLAKRSIREGHDRRANRPNEGRLLACHAWRLTVDGITQTKQRITDLHERCNSLAGDATILHISTGSPFPIDYHAIRKHWQYLSSHEVFKIL